MNIKVYHDADQLYEDTASFILTLIKDTIKEKGLCNIGLAGGNTYRSIYEIISEYEEEVPWEKVNFYWGDERSVPITHEDNNAAMVYDTLLNDIPVPSGNIHIIHGEKEPEYAAHIYNSLLKEKFGDSQGLDVLLLGVGADGHTASLFPGTSVLTEESKLASAVYVSKLRSNRITLTVPFLNRAEKVIFVALGASKAGAIKEIIEGEKNVDEFPAQLIQPTDGEVHWFLDNAAAEGLKQLS